MGRGTRIGGGEAVRAARGSSLVPGDTGCDKPASRPERLSAQTARVRTGGALLSAPRHPALRETMRKPGFLLGSCRFAPTAREGGIAFGGMAAGLLCSQSTRVPFQTRCQENALGSLREPGSSPTGMAHHARPASRPSFAFRHLVSAPLTDLACASPSTRHAYWSRRRPYQALHQAVGPRSRAPSRSARFKGASSAVEQSSNAAERVSRTRSAPPTGGERLDASPSSPRKGGSEGCGGAFGAMGRGFGARRRPSAGLSGALEGPSGRKNRPLDRTSIGF